MRHIHHPPPKLLGQNVRLVGGEDPEGVDDLLGCVNVCGLAGHKVEEAVELNVTGGVGVDNGEDALEVDLSLLVLSHTVSKRNQTVLELLGIQSPSLALVEVVEACPELVQLFLCDALAVSGQNLVFYFVDRSGEKIVSVVMNWSVHDTASTGQPVTKGTQQLVSA